MFGKRLRRINKTYRRHLRMARKDAAWWLGLHDRWTLAAVHPVSQALAVADHKHIRRNTLRGRR
jgi:hypothetical protein